MSIYMMGPGSGTTLTPRRAALTFLLVICIYVFCIMGVQINWANKTSLTSDHICDNNRDDDDCHRTTNESPVDKNPDNKQFFDVRRLFHLMGHTTDNGKKENETKNSLSKAFDKKDCFLPRKLDQSGMPIVHSVFFDAESRQVIIIGVLRYFNGSFNESWHGELFRCEHTVDNYTQIITFSDPIVQDYKRFGDESQFSVVITCPLPDELLNRQYFMMTLRRVSKPDLSYNNIIVCQGAPKKSPKHVLTMCTMTKNMDRYIPHWLNYYKFLGVEHVYIYDNEREALSTLPKTSKRYVDSGFLTIIPWAHAASPNRTHRELQVASENDCMWRYKHTSQWMIKVDVDEFLQPMDPNRTKITEYLYDENYDYDKLGSLRVQSWFFCRHPKVYHLKPLEKTPSVIERNLVRNVNPSEVNIGRDKAITRPANIHYYKIHGVKLGGDTVTLSPSKEMRMVHYRGDNPRHTGFCNPGRQVPDFSMIRLWYRLHGANMVKAEEHFNKMQELINGYPLAKMKRYMAKLNTSLPVIKKNSIKNKNSHS